ncbi:MAG: Membrane-associated zinc metalloprotease [Collimonas fungivorans]|uniref:RIP metalloprotease RseP n=1 Tax=Collimonas fungivorans TaxID=158899 RepID=UPI0026EE1223|nr:RIP metalloprotease RseP [Collimonas fungivorans]MDB5769125.1 Membrane-associated zinc metalloprotease [Collimonas fungivorans]
MALLQTILAFVVALGSLVIIHELGHYVVARLCGVKVLRFSVGMGKIVFSRKFGPDQTEWALSILPLGGYVKMLDAREQDVSGLSAQELKREFTGQSVWRRMAIVAAGPLANFALAILLFAGLYMHGEMEPTPRVRTVAEHTAAYQAGLRGTELITAVNGEPVQTWNELRWKVMQAVVDKAPVQLDVRRLNSGPAGSGLLDTVKLSTEGLGAKDLEGDYLGKLGIKLALGKPILGKVDPAGPAMKAGLLVGDQITAINGAPIADSTAFIATVGASAGKPLTLTGLRNGNIFTADVTPEAQSSKDGTIGRIKVELSSTMPEMVLSSSPPLQALAKGAKRTWDSSVLTLKMLGKMIVGELSWKNITGPITIADYAGQTARIGAFSYLSFIAFISISLGVMNLLPIPVLDGGHLLYYSLEVLTGRPIPERVGAIAQRAGIGILMTLMMVAMFNDIVRLIF